MFRSWGAKKLAIGGEGRGAEVERRRREDRGAEGAEGGGVWGGGVPFPTGGGVWGGGCAWFSCKICQKKFTRSYDLKLHLLQHGGVKPYVCDKCRKRFVTTSRVKSHHFVHSSYRQFCCGLCGNDFKRKGQVVRHFQRCSDKLGFGNV